MVIGLDGGAELRITVSVGVAGHVDETDFEALLKRAEITDLHIHDLRRTLGSWQAATGASLLVIGRTLAHTNPSTTAIYARLNLDPVRKAIETATRAMLETVNFEEDREENGSTVEE